jgi:coenzyme F430 synthetase
MKMLVVDMTHGGTTLASEFAKKQDCEVLAWDIYHTLNWQEQASILDQGIELVDDTFLEESLANPEDWDDLIVVAPVHCNLPFSSSDSAFPNLMTHHQAVHFLMKNRISVPIIEVTGVKGKTNSVAMFKEIFKDNNPLILSSLGIEILEQGEEQLLQKDISITPASIITAWELAKDEYDVGMCIFEMSLGGTGLADVGVLTNIAEDYPIASAHSRASQAKSQIFRSKIVACDNKVYQKYYKHLPLPCYRVNTFGVKGESNVCAKIIEYGLPQTIFEVEVSDLETRKGKSIDTSFKVSTFAPAKYHLENALSAICGSLSMGISKEVIIQGLKNFRGLPGRTSLKNLHGSRIIEEINPGINVTAIKKSVGMIKQFENPILILGGEYGVTCEEISEKSLLTFLNQLDVNIPLILTGELGKNINTNITRKSIYQSHISDAVDLALQIGGKNILLIYRSRYSNINRR